MDSEKALESGLRQDGREPDEAALVRRLTQDDVSAFDKIVKVLGLSRTAVDVRLHRARARLAEMLKDKFEEER